MATFCKNIAQNILLLSFVCRSVPWWHVRSRVFLIFLACKRCWSDLAEESRRAECGLGVLFLCISRLDRCLLRRFRGCGQVEQMHLGSIFVCMVQQSKFLGGRCGDGHTWQDVCQTQCAAKPDAPRCHDFAKPVCVSAFAPVGYVSFGYGESGSVSVRVGHAAGCVR